MEFRLVVLILVAFAMVLREQPIWSMGQFQDDAVYSLSKAGYLSGGQTLWDYAVAVYGGFWQIQGRFVPATAFLILPFWVSLEDNLILYRLIQTAFHLAALGAFALFVKTLTKDVLAGLLCAVLYVAVMEVRDFHDASHGQFILLPLVIVIGSLSGYFAIRASESAKAFDRRVWMVVLLNVVGALTYEQAIVFGAMSCLILLFMGALPWKTRLARAALAGLPVVLLAIVGIVLKATMSRYEGTQFGSIAAVADAYGKHLSAAVPLSYWWFDPHHRLQDLLGDARSYPAGVLSAGALALALGSATFMTLVRTRAASLAALALAGALLLLVPSSLIALSLKYQREAAAGAGYLQNSISYLGTCVLLFLVLHLACRAAARLGHAAMLACAALASAAVGVAGAVSLLSSYRVAEAINEDWRYPREQLEVWMHATQPVGGVDRPLLLIDRPRLYRWESPEFMWKHWGVHGNIISAAEAKDSREKPSAVLRMPDRPHPAAVNLFIESEPGNRTTRALVMSTSRERLVENALTLSRGTRSWPFPDDVWRGVHGYFFRELVIQGDIADVAEYRLTLSNRGAH